MQVTSRTGVLTRPAPIWAVLTCTLFALMVAVFARIAIPLPFTPVPFTLQPMAVMMTGLVLGSRLGAAALLEYLVLGALGAPVFAGGNGGFAYLAATSTLGYLLSYPIAVYLIGRLAENSRRGFMRLTLASLAGLAVIYLMGVAYLAGWLAMVKHVSGMSVIAQAWLLGAAPFVLFDAVKAVIAAAAARRKLFD